MIPDPDGKNEDRAAWTNEALLTFMDETGTDRREDALSELLADLGHLCDQEGWSFAAELRRAAGHYREETDGKGDQLTYE